MDELQEGGKYKEKKVRECVRWKRKGNAHFIDKMIGLERKKEEWIRNRNRGMAEEREERNRREMRTEIMIVSVHRIAFNFEGLASGNQKLRKFV